MIDRELNVLFLPKWYPSKFEEFDGNFIENHAIALSKKCHLGVIFVHSDDSVSQFFTVDKSQLNGFPEYRVYYKRPQFGFSLLNQVVSFFRYRRSQKIGYRAYLNDIGKPDLCHVHINGKSALLANFLKTAENIPFLITEHWSGYTFESGAFKGYFRKKFYQFTAKQSSGITCVSNYLKEAIKRHDIKANYSIVPNVVNTELFQPKWNKANNPIRIVHISNLTKSPKNIDLIGAALNEAGAQRTDFELDIIGTGPDENLMLEILNKGSMKDRFTFHREIVLEKVASILQHADFLVLYSQFETQSVVMIEAFASGVPVVISAVGGIPEYMNEERGILLEPNSAEALKKGILTMLDQYNQYDQQKLRNYALANFAEERIQDQFLHLYYKTLKEHA
ncbi:glycosyltransferase family 4 protein [Vicingaceae bacterium]|nr:glycosyltransferase family 4 protein [Vicingaceae bacterium]MDB4061981.1 glycosyltransferase family 4 protein [Vicingaceae bacterium]